jgi:formate dehydrogenase subunit delta
MSESKIERLVSMVNQIALNMSANGSDKMVADQVAQHLERFWSPPMKNLITEQPADADIGTYSNWAVSSPAAVGDSASEAHLTYLVWLANPLFSASVTSGLCMTNASQLNNS